MNYYARECVQRRNDTSPVRETTLAAPVSRHAGTSCVRRTPESVPRPAVSVVMSVNADKIHDYFGYSGSGREETAQIGQGECGQLATEVAGGFTGGFIAMYATGNGVCSALPAHFDWFEYQAAE